MATRTIATKLVIEGESEYKASLSNINREMKVLKSELEVVKSEFDSQANSMEALTAKGSVLAKLQETQAKSLSTLSDALENARKQNDAYLDAIEAQRSAIADLEAQMERSGNSFDIIDEETGELLRTISDATTEIEAMRNELAQLERKQEQAAKSVNDWQIKVNKAQVELNSLNRQIYLNDQYLDEARTAADQCATSIDNYGKSIKDAADSAGGAGESGSFLSGIFQKLGVDGNAVSSVLDKVGVSSSITDALLGSIGVTGGAVASALVAMGAKAVNAINQMLESTKEVRETLEIIRVNATEAGIAIADAENVLVGVYALSGDWGAAREASSSLLSLTQNAEQLKTVVDTLSDAATIFPDTLKIENLSESLQETVATGEATGQFAELIERLGLNIDEFNNDLEASVFTSDRVNVAMSALAKGGLEDLSTAYKEARSGAYELARIEGELEVETAKFAENTIPASIAWKNLKLELTEGANAAAVMANAVFNSGEAMQQEAEITTALKNNFAELMEQRYKAELSIADYESKCKNLTSQVLQLKMAYEEAETAALDSIQNQMTIWSEYDTSTETTIGNIIGTMNQQVEWMNNYAQFLREAEIAGLSQELIEQLSNGTQESYEYLAAIHGASEQQIQELNNAYSVVQERQKTFASDLVEAQKMYENEMAAIQTQLSGLAADMDLSEETAKAGVNTIKGFLTGSKDEETVRELLDYYSALGDAVYNSFADSLEIHSPSRKFQWAAQMTFDPLITEAEKAQLELAERSYNMGVSIINNYDAGTAAGGSTGSMYNSVPSTGTSAMPSLYESQQQPITIKFTGSLSQMARIMKPSFDQEDRRVGKRPIAGLR